MYKLNETKARFRDLLYHRARKQTGFYSIAPVTGMRLIRTDSVCENNMNSDQWTQQPNHKTQLMGLYRSISLLKLESNVHLTV